MAPNPIWFGAMDGPKPYKFIRFGAMDVTKPYKFIRFGAMDVTKPYKFIGFEPKQLPRTGYHLIAQARGSCVGGRPWTIRW